MAHIWKDRVQESSTTTGTGAFTLAGAVAGFRTFASVCSTNDTVYYFIEAVDGNGVPTGDWETGLGTYSGTNTLTRTTVLDSSNSGSAVNFSSGTKRVGLCAPARVTQNVGLVESVAPATAGSGSSFATKGAIILLNADMTIIGAKLNVSASDAGATYKIVIAVTNSSGVIQSILYNGGAAFAAATAATYIRKFGPIYASSGQYLAVMAVRSDGTSTSICRVYSATISAYSGFAFSWVGSVRYATTSPAVSDSALFDTASAFDISLIYTTPST